MDTIQNTKENLCRLADHLLKTRNQLIADWRRRAAADALLPTLNTLSRKEFLDHIPHILDVLEQQMRTYHEPSPPGLSERKAEKMEIHGLSRWQQGFSVTEVVRDWNHLRCAILDEISSAVEEYPDWVDNTFSESVGILADLIAEGINESVAKFEEIRQAEARSHTLDLVETIKKLKGLIDTQDKRYRETYHDLRGHLGILASLTNTLKRTDNLENTLHQLYEPLEDGLGRSLELLESVRLHSALEAGQEIPEAKRFNVSETIQTTLQPYQTLAEEKGIAFKTFGPEKLFVESDPLNFARILQNLMHNALKFTRSGEIVVKWGMNGKKNHWLLRIQNSGTFSPSRSSMPIAKKMVAASQVNPGKRVDTSIDTRNDHAGPLPEPTPQEAAPLGADPSHKGGEGIGLSIAKRLSDLLGGRLTLESEDDGCTVSATLYLPTTPDIEYA